MAARENLGLQIAIIIFVTLTITLSVSTFALFRHNQELLAQKNHADDGQREAVQQTSTLRAENVELKQIIGAAADETLRAIQTRFEADRKNYASAFKDGQPRYRQLISYLHAELVNSDARFVAAKQREEQLRSQIAADEQVKIGEVAKYALQLRASAADLANERNNFNSTRDEVEKSKDEIAKQIEICRKAAERFAKKASDEIAGLSKALTRAEALLTVLRVERLDRQRFSDLPRGVVTWVNQRDRVAWINVGADDNLRRQVSFKVLDPSEPNLGDAKGKAKLETIRLLDKHLAECRIVEDKVSDPIVPGDKIYSQAWSPSGALHFALAGFMDLDGDGQSDRARVKNLIAASGGVIDAEISDDGKRTGELSLETSYVICGERPSGKRISPEFVHAYSQLLDEAETLGVRQMSLHEFLNSSGYVPPPRMVALDGDDVAENSAFRSVEGPPRASYLRFAPRRPRSASSQPSAY